MILIFVPKTESMTAHTEVGHIVQSVLTQAGIAAIGLLSARRYICRTTMVTTTAKTHRQIMNRKYITTNVYGIILYIVG